MAESEPADESMVPKPECTPGEQESLDSAVNQVSLEASIETYHAIAEWIRFADAKAAVVLTVGGAFAGLLIPSIKSVWEPPSPEGTAGGVSIINFFTLVMFVTYLSFLLASSIYAFWCINPFRNRGEHPSLPHCKLFHPAAIASEYDVTQVDEFCRDQMSGGAAEIRRQVQAAILLDSHISASKYERVTKSIKLFAISVFFGFWYYLLLQF